MTACFRSVDPSRNRFRWYSLRLQPCLFGGVDLIRVCGRLGQHGGTERVDHFPDWSWRSAGDTGRAESRSRSSAGHSALVPAP